MLLDVSLSVLFALVLFIVSIASYDVTLFICFIRLVRLFVCLRRFDLNGECLGDRFECLLHVMPIVRFKYRTNLSSLSIGKKKISLIAVPDLGPYEPPHCR